MSLSLKHIPCPAGPNCSAYMCLFGGHGSDQETAEPPMGPKLNRTEQTTTPGNESDIGDSRKAIKLDSSQSTPSRSAANQTASRPAQLPSGTNPAPSQKLRSLQRPISPPAKKPISASPAPTKPEKKESLNPRLLKHSPASHEIRLKLVKMLHTEYKRLNDELKKKAQKSDHRLIFSDQALITRVLDEEEAVAVGKASVYSNVMKNNVMKYKRLNVEDWFKEREKEKPVGKKRQLDAMEGNAVIVETGLTPAQEVQLLHRILTRVDELSNHGYVSTIPTDEAVAKAKAGLDAAQGWEQCDRCAQRFQVFAGRRAEDGALASGGACNFHWGKSYFPSSAPGDRTKQPKRFLCCGQQMGDSAGCFTHPNHVFKAGDPKRLGVVLNYAATPENPTAPTDRAVCFDCEMGYTVYGMELIRLTATSWPDGAEILDVLVKPFGEILDLNSRYSGVFPNDLAQAEEWRPGDALVPSPVEEDDASSEDGQVSKRKLKIVSSPAVARNLLFSLISPSTPLIGHGLENDLNAVRVVHPTLIDTVLLTS
ncbi:hypothetical protein NLG97_g2803 [Lecanicillium saksenae]|uniref:Uncharacterized protein n=1 Tax=Lecanicillium saksenae TaxID=468837 RepID=A0ACC1QZY6_9HYPO|nr:hypothetical protein NLG97_g2803 [Lecanicillium saksenae]